MLKNALRRARIVAKQIRGIEPRIPVTAHVPLEFHGNADGGWNIIRDSLDARSVVVDIGIGEDVSFPESIIRKYGCTVHGFDPTPRAIAFVAGLGNERLTLDPVAIGTEPGRAEFYLPNNTAHVSGSLRLEEHVGGQRIDVELITLGQIFERVGSDRIDVLKLDVEGTEYELIQSSEFAARASAIGQLCVEFHHRWKGRGRVTTENAVSTLRRLGFDCAWRSPTTNEEFLFVHRARGG